MLLHRAGGVLPSLSLDLAGAGAFPSGVTFTRASTATFVGSNGLIQSAASGQARFGYDPVTLAALGYLSEEARTNLLLNSKADGTNLSTQTVTVVNGTVYALSFYGTGSIVNSGANAATLAGSGAYPTRSVLVFTASTTSLTLTVSGTVQFANLEATSTNYPGPTSYIATAGSTVTRAADVASMTGNDFSSWYNQTSGTFVTTHTPPGDYNQMGVVLAAGTTTFQNNFALWKVNAALTAAGKTWVSNIIQGGSDQVLISDGTSSTSTTTKLAFAAQVNDAATATNGTITGTDASVVMPSPNQIFIGLRSDPNFWFNGHITSIKYYPTRLPNALLQSFTS